MTLIVVRGARLRPTRSSRGSSSAAPARLVETVAFTSSSTGSTCSNVMAAEAGLHRGSVRSVATTIRASSRLTVESSGLAASSASWLVSVPAPTCTTTITSLAATSDVVIRPIAAQSGSTLTLPTTVTAVPAPSHSVPCRSTLVSGVTFRTDWSAASVTIPTRQISCALSDVKVSPVMSGDVFCTVEWVSKVTQYRSGMRVETSTYPVMGDVFPSGAVDTQWATTPLSANVTTTCDVFPVFSADRSLSGLHSVESPRVGSSSAVFGDFSLHQEYAFWYEMLQVGVPSMALQLFATGAAMRAQFVRLAVARWMAMGYSDVVTAIREHLVPRIEDVRVRSLLDAVSMLAYDLRQKTYTVTFRAPPIRGYVPGTRIVRSAPISTSLVSITGSFRDAVWLTLVTKYGWEAGMFVSRVESWARQWEDYMSRVASELGAEAVGVYNTLRQVDVDHEEILRTVRRFVREIEAEAPPEIHEYIETGMRAADLEEVLRSATGYARSFYRFVSMAPIVFAAISRTARVVGVDRLRRFREAYESFRRHVDTLNEFLTKKRILGRRVPDWAPGFVEAYAGIHLGLASALTASALIKHAADPTPGTWVEMMSEILTRYTAVGLGFAMAALKACELVSGDAANPYYVLHEMTARLMVVPEKADLISQVIGKMVPKDVEEWMLNVANQMPYMQYLGLLLNLIPLAREGIAWLEKYVEGIKRIVGRAGVVGPPTPGTALGSFLLAMRRTAIWMPADVAEDLRNRATKLMGERLTKPPCPEVDPNVFEDDSRWVLFREWIKGRSK